MSPGPLNQCEHPRMAECHPPKDGKPGCAHWNCPDCGLYWDDADEGPWPPDLSDRELQAELEEEMKYAKAYRGEPKTTFCDYCDCEICQKGDSLLSHAKTKEGKWICDVCYNYEVCLAAGVQHPCRQECEHRPTLVGPWEPGVG